mmetsp:Transcript_5280/g.10549  ORF Transcript_5280/g.10549 Transcript_5280/m.10549 type:complete len:127 (-) Transcript_5280:504-884(-)
MHLGSPTTTTDDKRGGGDIDCTREPPRPRIDHLRILSEQQCESERYGVGMLERPDFKRNLERACDSGSRTGMGVQVVVVVVVVVDMVDVLDVEELAVPIAFAPVKVGVDSPSTLYIAASPHGDSVT